MRRVALLRGDRRGRGREREGGSEGRGGGGKEREREGEAGRVLERIKVDAPGPVRIVNFLTER